MNQTRIKDLNMSEWEVCTTMSGSEADGYVAGAVQVCFDVFARGAEIDPDAFAPVATLVSLDFLGVYEERLWMLYSDVCGQDLSVLFGVVRAWQLGFLSAEALNAAIDQDVVLDFEDLLAKVQAELPDFRRVVAPCPAPDAEVAA